MPQSEFEFWKIDSAFGQNAISAYLEKNCKNTLLEKLIEESGKYQYNLNVIGTTFEKFGWGDLIPKEVLGQKLLSAEELGGVLRPIAIERYGKNNSGILTTVNVAAMAYLAQKTLDLYALIERKKIEVKISSFKGTDIDFLMLAKHLFRKDKVQDRLNTSILTVMAYAIAKDFKSGLEKVQSKVTGYTILRGLVLPKTIDQALLTFIGFSKTANLKAWADSYELTYTLKKDEKDRIKLLSESSKKAFGYNIVRVKDGRVLITNLIPFRIMANYFGIKGGLNEATIKKIAELLETGAELEEEKKPKIPENNAFALSEMLLEKILANTPFHVSFILKPVEEKTFRCIKDMFENEPYKLKKVRADYWVGKDVVFLFSEIKKSVLVRFGPMWAQKDDANIFLNVFKRVLREGLPKVVTLQLYTNTYNQVNETVNYDSFMTFCNNLFGANRNVKIVASFFLNVVLEESSGAKLLALVKETRKNKKFFGHVRIRLLNSGDMLAAKEVGEAGPVEIDIEDTDVHKRIDGVTIIFNNQEKTKGIAYETFESVMSYFKGRQVYLTERVGKKGGISAVLLIFEKM